MRALIVSCVFPPEPTVSGKISHQIAQALHDAGNEVDVFTSFPSRPAGKLYPGYRKSLYHREIIEAGYELLHCFSSFSTQSSVLSRFFENITFGLTSSLAVLFTKRPDVIYLNTWPIIAQSLLVLVARLRQIPLVLNIQDLYPESLLVQGRLTDQHPIIKFSRLLDILNAKNSQSIIVISDRFAQVYRDDRGIDEEKVIVVPNWGNESEPELPASHGQIRQQFGIAKKDLLLVYGGNIGVAAGVEDVIQAIARLPKNSNIKFLIAGEGSQLKSCQQLAEREARNLVIFHTPWPQEETQWVLRSADILLLPTKGNQSTASVPSKFISYLYSARPIIALVNEASEMASLIRQIGCGWVLEPDRPEKLVELLLIIRSLSRQELDLKGEAGREYAMKHLSREENIHRTLKILSKAAKKPTVAGSGEE